MFPCFNLISIPFSPGKLSRSTVSTSVVAIHPAIPTLARNRSLFSGTLNHWLAPDGCGSGTRMRPSRSNRSPMAAVILPNSSRRAERQAADRNEHAWVDAGQLAFQPRRAEGLLRATRHAVAAARRVRPRITASDRRHRLRGAELGLIETRLRQPAKQAAPRRPGERLFRDLGLVTARRLPHRHETRAGMTTEDGPRSQVISGRHAPPAAGQIGMERLQRRVGIAMCAGHTTSTQEPVLAATAAAWQPVAAGSAARPGQAKCPM